MGYSIRLAITWLWRRMPGLLSQLVVDRLPTRSKCVGNFLMEAVQVLVEHRPINLELDVTARTERTVIGLADLFLQARRVKNSADG